MSVAVLEKCASSARMPGSCPVIESERLVLRPHRRGDADAIAGSLGDFSVSRMLSRVPQPYDRQDALDWLSPILSGVSPDWTLAITTGDDVHIGAVGIEIRHGLWHLGFWLNRFYWGRGYMSEASSALLERFLRRMPEVPVYSGAFADNAASLRIQQKLGFKVTNASEIFNLARNRMTPHIETVLVAEDFRRQQRP